jgi:hypothetical protein
MADENAGDGFLAKLDQLLAKHRAPAPEGSDGGADGAQGGGRVPRHRLQAVVEKNRSLEAALTELRGQHEAAVTQLRTEAAQQVADLEARYRHDLELADLGVKDSRSRRVVRNEWGELAEDERPESPAAMLRGLREGLKAHQDDPEKHEAPEVPVYLRGLVDVEPAGQQQHQQQHRPPPNVNQGARRPDARDSLAGKDFDSVGDFFAELQRMDRAVGQ